MSAENHINQSACEDRRKLSSEAVQLLLQILLKTLNALEFHFVNFSLQLENLLVFRLQLFGQVPGIETHESLEIFKFQLDSLDKLRRFDLFLLLFKQKTFQLVQ